MVFQDRPRLRLLASYIGRKYGILDRKRSLAKDFSCRGLVWATHQVPSMRPNWASSGCIEGGLSLDFSISKGVVDRWSDVLLRANRCVVRRMLVCGRSVDYCSDTASICKNAFEG